MSTLQVLTDPLSRWRLCSLLGFLGHSTSLLHGVTSAATRTGDILRVNVDLREWHAHPLTAPATTKTEGVLELAPPLWLANGEAFHGAIQAS